jgi:putative tryptophan/tyrosine transport system substrate-binding protein
MIRLILLFVLWSLVAIGQSGNQTSVPVVGFLDFIQDPTIELAKKGFFDALEQNGFSEKAGTISVIYANAQGDIPVLSQACDLLISKKPALLATNITLPTITAVKKTNDIPVFMMVAPRPDIAGLTDASGNAPSNLFGVYETLDYLDTSVTLMKELRPSAKIVGTIYNQSEPQSVDAFNKLKEGCAREGMTLEALPVNNSSETQLVMQALMTKNIDVFFALPDNIIFASFETVFAACDKKNIPIFTSEAGLVSRGAVASYGADFYQWGFQSGLQAASFLKSGSTSGLKPEIVNVRKREFNTAQVKKYGVTSTKSENSFSTEFLLTAILQGLAYLSLALGVFLSLRIFNIPDITTDGSFTLGGSVTAILLTLHFHPVLVLIISVASGMIAGTTTGLILTRLKIQPLLAGILTMTALYSVNLSVMGRSNLPLADVNDVFGLTNFKNTNSNYLFILITAVIIVIALLYYILRTDFGIAMRATGNSEQMVRSMGVNTARMKVTGLAIANGLTAFSGYLIAQYQGFADINMGLGIVISGLGSVMIGEALLKRYISKNIIYSLLAVLAGSIAFRLIIAAALSFGLNPNFLKLITAFIVLLIVALSSRERSHR